MLIRQATELAEAILTPQLLLAPKLFCDGQPMAVVSAHLGLRSRQHLWDAYRRPAVEAVTRVFLAYEELPPN